MSIWQMHARNNLASQEEFVVTRVTARRALLALTILVLGNLQAWDTDVPSAGVWTVLLVSLATALPAARSLSCPCTCCHGTHLHCTVKESIQDELLN